MAGLGRKVFAAGDVLSAADVDGYLMDQTVQTFATSAARSSAVGTAVSEGMVAYLKATDTNDTANQLDFYNGSAWEPVRGYDVAGKNKVINGGMDFWQRGTSSAMSGNFFLADRWNLYRGAYASGATASRQTTGLTGLQYALRVQRDSGNASTAAINADHNIETVASIPLAGQTITLSFYARAGASYSSSGNTLTASVNSGTGTDEASRNGFTGNANIVSSPKTLTTSWQRFSVTGVVSSSATQLGINFSYAPTGTAGAADYFEITGVQLEAGSVATPFSRAGGTIQGELAACQRYYWRTTSGSDGFLMSGTGSASSTTNVTMLFTPPVNLRSSVSVIDYSLAGVTDHVTSLPSSSLVVLSSQPNAIKVNFAVSGATQYRPYLVQQYGVGSGFIGFSAEL